MSYEIHADHDQQYLLPPAVEHWVPPDHPVRFIRDFVQQLDLVALGFHQRVSTEGRPSYSSEMLLGIWLYGYLEKIRSSRKLEAACRDKMPLIWLTGMHYPDHNSLWRFWRNHQKAITRVFAQSVRVARELGLLGMVVHALDGTKITVQTAAKGALHRKDLERLHEAIADSITAMERTLEAEAAEEHQSSLLPEALHEAHARRNAIEEALATLAAQEQEHALAAEPDARLMQQQGRTQWSYNAQAVVDDAHGIVVAQAVSNEATDYRQLTPMLETVAETAGANAQTTVADAGYRSAPQQAQAQADGHNVLLPEHGREGDTGHPYHKSRFRYDEANDCYWCPEGKKLLHSRTAGPRVNRAGARVYRCRECKHCPMRPDCTRARDGRTIRRDHHEALREEQRAQRETPEAQALLRRRKAIIEPLFGHIKENLGFRRWSARGLEHARTQWAMLCLSVNLKKLYALWKQHRTPDPNGFALRAA